MRPTISIYVLLGATSCRGVRHSRQQRVEGVSSAGSEVKGKSLAVCVGCPCLGEGCFKTAVDFSSVRVCAHSAFAAAICVLAMACSSARRSMRKVFPGTCSRAWAAASRGALQQQGGGCASQSCCYRAAI